MSKYSGWWLPVMVLLFVVVSAAFLFRPEFLESLNVNSAQAEQDAIAVANLKNKLELLSAVNVPLESDRLKYLNTAVPTTKMVWSIVTQLQIAASGSGSVVREYSAGVGKGVAEATEAAVAAAPVSSASRRDEELLVKAKVNFSRDDGLIAFFDSLYSRLPLVSVKRLVYKSGVLEADLVSAWAANSKIVPGGDLPAYAPAVDAAMSLLSGLVSFPEVQAEEGDPAKIVNPF